MNAKKDPNASYKLLAKALIKYGYSLEEYLLGNRDIAKYSFERKIWITQINAMSYPFTHRLIRDISAHKQTAYDLAKKLNVPIPFTVSVNLSDDIEIMGAEQWLDKYSKLIVKPEEASLSRGLTMNIRSLTALKDAVDLARVSAGEDAPVLIQEQVHGDEIRFVYLGGEIVAALLRRSPYVIGDGVQTIKQLIDMENNERKNIKNSMVEYPQLDEKLIMTKLNYGQIPPLGEKVELSKSTMIREGASVYNVIKNIYPDHIKLAKTMASSIGANFIVIDMIVEDYTNPKKIYFNEFNVSPVLKLFYSCRDGKNFDILPMLAEQIDRQLMLGMDKNI